MTKAVKPFNAVAVYPCCVAVVVGGLFLVIRPGSFLVIGKALSGLEAKQVELQERAAAMEREILKLEGQQIDADIVRNNLLRFDELFRELKPEEQRRFVQLLVREVKFDGIGGQMRLCLRPLPALNLELDQTGDLSKGVQIGCPNRTLLKTVMAFYSSFPSTS